VAREKQKEEKNIDDFKTAVTGRGEIPSIPFFKGIEGILIQS
jgi:hypothetical protein